MTTGYWVEGTTTDRTKTHVEDDGKPLCGFPLGRRNIYQLCANGYRRDYVECTKCKRLMERTP